MFTMQTPEIGSWYVNQTGQLLKVKMLVHDKQILNSVLIQYLDGNTRLVSIDDWLCLKLNRHIHKAGLNMQLH